MDAKQLSSVLPDKPDQEILSAIYRAWDHYGKREGFMGSPEATRIYGEILNLARERCRLQSPA